MVLPTGDVTRPPTGHGSAAVRLVELTDRSWVHNVPDNGLAGVRVIKCCAVGVAYPVQAWRRSWSRASARSAS
ncbi:hypothetical protein ACFVT1_12985 [Streptomyces sp. NPDC057963]|uniref:hypothetical protein n=1 Tax=Streptomyces sp. NPDC057963 TaxID=3346290 RepID=UPI0036E8DA52